MAKGSFKEKPEVLHSRNLDILKEKIKSHSLGGCYIFYGPEEYTKNYYYSQLCSLCSDASLNKKSFYFDEFDLYDFINSISTYAAQSIDMFSLDDEQDAQEENTGMRVIKLIEPDFSQLSKKEEEQFIEVISELSEDVVVLFWFYPQSKPDFSKGIYKKIAEMSLIVNFPFEAPGSPSLIKWTLKHFSLEKINVERYVAVYLLNCVGNDMTNLKNEIDKLIEYLRFENRDTLTNEDIDFLCTKSLQAQIFDISGGAFAGNYTKAAKALKFVVNNKEDPLVILGTLSKTARDLCLVDKYSKMGLASPDIAKKANLFEFSVRNLLTNISKRDPDFKGTTFAKVVSDLVLEYDTRIKSSKTNPYELLSELVLKISIAGRKAD